MATPSATSEIVSNNYNYSTINDTYTKNDNKININAQFIVGEEVVSEGVLSLVSDEIDRRQGVKIQMKRRGVTA